MPSSTFGPLVTAVRAAIAVLFPGAAVGQAQTVASNEPLQEIGRWQLPSAPSGPSVYASTILADGPAAYYRLGEASGSTAADSSTNHRNATYQAGVQYGQPGAIYGDSDTAIGAPSSGAAAIYAGGAGLPNGNTARSEELWFKTSSTAPQTLLFYGTATTAAGFGIGIPNSTTLNAFFFGDDVSWTVPNVADGNWHYYAVTYDGGGHLTGYLDALTLLSQTAPSQPNTVLSDLRISTLPGGAYPVVGTLDEVAIYPIALSASQVAAHLRASGNQPSAPPSVTATSGVNQATAQWQVASANGAPITGYVVTAYAAATPQNAVGTGPSTSTATVFGLSGSGSGGGSGYTLQVAAGNRFGMGAASISNNVVPSGNAATYSTLIRSNAPSLYYRLADGVGTFAADSSGSGVMGTYQPSATMGTAGSLFGDPDTAITNASSGPALETNTSTGLPVGNAPRSLEAWFKPTTGVFQLIVGYGTLTTAQYFSLALHDGLHLDVATYFDDVSFPTGKTLIDGAWHHAIAVYDGNGHATMYLDGASLGTLTLPSPTLNTVVSPQGLIVGGATASGQNFTGSLGEIAVYPAVITAAQAAQRVAPGSVAPVTAVSGSNQVTVSWQPAPANGGTALWFYLIYAYVGSSFRGGMTVTPATTSVTITGLAGGTPYTFAVYPFNTVWANSGPYSSNAAVPTGAASTYATTVLAQRPALYYRLDDTFPIAIDAAGTTNVFYSGGITLGTPGAIVGDPDTAVTFDGTGHMDVGNPAVLQTLSVTVDCWVKPTLGMNGYVANKFNAWNLGINSTAGQPSSGRLGFYDYSTGGYGSFAAPTLFDGNWHHLTMALTSGAANGMTLSIDGAQVGAFTATIKDEAGNVVIGGTDTGYPYKGALDEFVIYPRAAGVFASPDWVKQTTTLTPSARWGAAAAYDAARNNTVVFGGFTNPAGTYFNDTWIWTGSQWVSKSPAASPPARDDSSLAFDPATQTTILFGGTVSGPIAFSDTYFQDTWSWDGQNWTQLFPATSPSARSGAAIYYDPGLGKLILFGGYSATHMPDVSTTYSDTWSFNGSTWTQLSPTSSPSARWDASLVYDKATASAVLFGGSVCANQPCGANANYNAVATRETWTFTGTAWIQANPLSSPSGRASYGVAYDDALQGVVFFGGLGQSGGGWNDTWLWNGTTWVQAVGIAAPSGRGCTAMAYNPTIDQIVLFGGCFGVSSYNDTWTYSTAVPTVTKCVVVGSTCASGAPPLIPRGGSVSYQVTVGNPGTSSASGVALQDSPTVSGLLGYSTLPAISGGSASNSCSTAGAPTAVSCVVSPGALVVNGLSLGSGAGQNVITIQYSVVAAGSERACTTVSNNATVTNSIQRKASASVPITVCDNGLGKETWWSFVSQAIGPQSMASANVANGNLLVQEMDTTPVQAHGRLAYVLRRSYNSQDTTLLSLPGAQSWGAGWTLNVDQVDDLVGDGVGSGGLYVPSISSALQVAAVTLIDRDGTRHVFQPSGLTASVDVTSLVDSGGPLGDLVPKILPLSGTSFTRVCATQTYTAPPGVHLGLWRYVGINSSGSCSNLASASPVLLGFVAERTDRVRYEFAADGSMLDMMDGSGVELRYLYENQVAPGLPIGRPTAVYEPRSCQPGTSPPTAASLTNCRSFQFKYATWDAATAYCPASGHAGWPETDITDPAGRTTALCLDSNNPANLVMTLAFAPSAAAHGTPVSRESYVYQQTSATGGCGGGAAPFNHQLCSITDPRGNTTTFTYYSSTNCSGSQSPCSYSPSGFLRGTSCPLPTIPATLPRIASINDRRQTPGYGTSFCYATQVGGQPVDETIIDQAGERSIYSNIDVSGRVGQIDQGDYGAAGQAWTPLHTTYQTWDGDPDAQAGGNPVYCRQPNAGVDNNLCHTVRRSNNISTPDEDASYSYGGEGQVLRMHRLNVTGALDTTFGYHAQYFQASGAVNGFDDTVQGSGVVTSSGPSSGRSDAATLFALSDKAQSLPPRGNAAGSGYAPYLTTYKVDNNSVFNPNASAPSAVCTARGGPTSNTGSLCETDEPAFAAGQATITRYTYDTFGQKVTMTTPKSIAETPSGQTAPSYTYTYFPDPSQSNDATQTKDLSGTTPQGGWLKGETDPTGHFVAFAYDAAGNVARTWDRDATSSAAPPNNTLAAYPGTTTSPPSPTYAETLHGSGSTAYSAPWRFVLSKRDPLSNLTTEAVDANGNRLTERPPRGNAAGNGSYDATRTYDANDNLVTVLMPTEAAANKPTTYTYDALNNRTATTDPNGSVIVTQYDAVNRPTASLSTRGPWPSDTTTVPPACRQSTSADSPIPAGRILCSTTTAYDGVDNKTATQDGNHQTTTVTYDGVHRAIRAVGPRTMTYGDSTTGGTETETTYDADGRVIDVCPPRQFALGEGGFAPTQACQQPAVYSHHMTYDTMGRLATKSTYRVVGSSTITATTSTAYDADGNAISATDANAHTTTTTFDVLDRKASTTVPRSSSALTTTSYVHDSVGNTTAVVQSALDVGDGRDGALVIDGSQYPFSNPYVLTDRTKQYSSVTLQNGGWIAAAILEVPGGGALILRVSGALTICSTCGLEAGGRGWWAGSGGVASGPNYNGGAAWGPGGGGGGGSSYVDGGGGGGAGNVVAGGDGVGGAFGINGFGAKGGYQADAKDISQEDLAHQMGAGGGGGGAGGLIYNGGDGGRGGGFIHVSAGSIDDEGVIQSAGWGAPAVPSIFGTYYGGGGGGGAGGSVWLSAPTITLGNWQSIWVPGGTGAYGAGGDSGGNGALGRIRIDADTLSGAGANGNVSWVNPARHVAGRITAYSYDTDNRVVDTVTGADNLDARSAGLVSADGGTNVRSRVAYDADGRIAARFEPRAFVSSTLVPDPLFMSRTDFDQDGRAIAQYVPRYDNVDDGGAYSDGYTSDSSPDTQQQQCPKGAAPQVVATAPAYPSNVGVCVTHLSFDASGNLSRVVLPTTSSAAPVPNRVVNYLYTDDHLRLAVDAPSPSSISSASALCPSGDTSTGPRAVTCSLYDGDGKVVAQTDPLGHRALTTYTADELVAQTTGQPNQTVAHVTQYAYDANGNQTLVTDPVGVQTQTVYFSDNRKSQVITAAQDTTGVYKAVTSYTYDAAGNPVSVASPSATARDANNPLGIATANTYTFDNLLLSETQPYKIPASGQQQVRRTSFTYDAGGRKLTQSVQVLDGGSGSQISDGGGQTFTYFPDDRQATQTGRSGETISTQYDAAGNPTSIADSTSGTITAQYYLDSKPRYVADFARFSGDPVRAVRYVWDGLGSLLTRTDGVTAGPSNWYYATGYAYGDAEQLTYDVANLTSWNTITYSYDVAGRQLSQVNPSGTTVSRTYNDDGTLASQVATMNGQSSNLESWCYAYDGNYRQLSQTVAAGGTGTTCAGGTTYSYNYDASNRLCGFHVNGSLPACSATTSPDRISYDHDGNRLSYTPQGATQASTFAYNADDSIASGPTGAGQSSTHTYDAVGRLLSDTCAKYSYDGFDRTTGVAADTGCPTALGAAYAYDGLDRQIEHTEGGVSTSNHFDGLTSAIVTTKKVNSGSNETAYEVDPAGQDLLLLNLNWTGSPNYIRQYLSDDGHGNIATVTADLPSTATLCGVRYDPWGTIMAAPTGLSQCVYSGTNPAPNTLNEFYYRGGRRDAATGDYQFGSRTYNPAKADFLTRDTYRQAAPAADLGVGVDPLTANRYNYVNGDPVNLVDPTGHDPWWQDTKSYHAQHPEPAPGHYSPAYNPGAGTLDAGNVQLYHGTPMQVTIAPWRGNVCLDRCARDYWGKRFGWNPDWNGTAFWDCSPRAGRSSCTDESHTYAFNGQQTWGIVEYNDHVSSGLLGSVAGLKDEAAHVTIDMVTDPYFLEYWGSYALAGEINSAGSHFGPVGSAISHVVALPLALPEAEGLLVDVAGDRLKSTFLPDYLGVGDEGATNPRPYLLGSQVGPLLAKFGSRWDWHPDHFPGIDANGHVDFEW